MFSYPGEGEVSARTTLHQEDQIVTEAARASSDVKLEALGKHDSCPNCPPLKKPRKNVAPREARLVGEFGGPDSYKQSLNRSLQIGR